ncbi:glycosyltransferase family 2 protein [Patescibacteria group bacterium]|nr:glycosyltransferase family 2 protein [Patescibacteria group bacterium]
MMTKQPFFSILIPSYNRPHYLAKCLKLVFENDFKDFEVVVSDDHSQKMEEIENVIKPYLDFQNFTFIKQPQNLGLHGNYNFLAGKTRGKFRIIVDDDDKLHPDTLRKLKEYIDHFPGYDLYGFGYEIIDENERVICSYCPPKAFELSLSHPKFVRNLFFSDILPFWAFQSFAICCKREVGEEIKYQKEASIGSDLVLLFQSMNKGKKMFVIPEVLFSYRKAQNTGQKEYFNWTGPAITNIMARRDILYNILYQARDLNPIISKLVLSDYYRRRYLFDPIIFNKLMQEETLKKINLKEEHLKELKGFFRPKNYLFHHLRIRFEQLVDYIKLFGPKGLFQIFLIFSQKFLYQLKNNG